MSSKYADLLHLSSNFLFQEQKKHEEKLGSISSPKARKEFIKNINDNIWKVINIHPTASTMLYSWIIVSYNMS